MRVSPAAETDPSAVSIKAEGCVRCPLKRFCTSCQPVAVAAAGAARSLRCPLEPPCPPLSPRTTRWDLPAEAIALRYLPDGRQLPPSVVLGRADLAATMRGSGLAPTIDVDFKLPEPRAEGSLQVQLRRRGS